MSGQIEAHLKDYLWVSVVQYMRWLAVNCDLYDFSPGDIWSFKITAPGGILALRSKKIKTSDRLKANVKVIEEFAVDSELAGDRLEVVQTLVRNMSLYIEVVEDHILSLDKLTTAQSSFAKLEYTPIDEDEPPF